MQKGDEFYTVTLDLGGVPRLEHWVVQDQPVSSVIEGRLVGDETGESKKYFDVSGQGSSPFDVISENADAALATFITRMSLCTKSMIREARNADNDNS